MTRVVRLLLRSHSVRRLLYRISIAECRFFRRFDPDANRWTELILGYQLLLADERAALAIYERENGKL